MKLSTAREVAEHFGVEPGTVLDWNQQPTSALSD
jgi:hypothetical protein